MLLETRGLSKRFGQQYALKQVNLQILPGEIHGLVGENGAGKSTLIKILTGVYTRDEGQVLWEGKEVSDLNPVASRRLGINVIHQDRHLIPQFNAVENVYLGLEYETRGAVAIDWKQMRSAVERIMQELSIELPLNVPAMYLTLHRRLCGDHPRDDDRLQALYP